MDKNTIIGLLLMGLVLFGFTFYQNKQYQKQAAWQAHLDSIAAVEQYKADSAAAAAAAVAAVTDTADVPVFTAGASGSVYKDSLLALSHDAEGELVTLANDRIEVVFTTKGGQPYSARLKEFRNYGGTDLYLFRPEASHLGIQVYAGENINTADFNFNIVEQTDSSVTMRLPFSGGGFIQQAYVLRKDSYSVDDRISFVGMDGLIPRNVSSLDINYFVTMPRMEKGYRNEVQYSKLNYYFNGEKKPEVLGRGGRSAQRRVDNRVSWFAFQQQFFSAIVRAPQEFSSSEFSIAFQPEDDPDSSLMACEARLRTDFKAGQPETVLPLEFYFGPNHFRTLKSYDHKYEKIIPLGGWLVGWFTRYVIIPLFDFLHRFISNFGIIILLMTIFIKIVVFPFAYKSYSSSAKMQAIKPEIDKLSAKYPKQEDAMKKQQAQMDLYRRAGISPMGGCLPMLLQFPILWAMFRFFPASIELRQQPFLWADDLSAYDSIVDFGTRIPLIGDHLSLFALLMAVSMFFYSKIMQSQTTAGNDPNAKMMQAMSLYMMPIMMFFICNNLSSGLSYYYLLSNLITMLETFIIRKWVVDPDEVVAKVKAAENKPVPKSKWQQRLEEAQKMQREMEKQKAKGRKR
ncbi:MAG: membrane protein insertase YidC [Bacteroidales bacterium]|nr:membrane protein insertase YidC [Bacteroidales bacterium]